jgi:hypothetical protein
MTSNTVAQPNIGSSYIKNDTFFMMSFLDFAHDDQMRGPVIPGSALGQAAFFVAERMCCAAQRSSFIHWCVDF